MLVAKASNPLSLIAGLAYSLCLVLLFGISALYHRNNWSQKKRAIMRRIDHSAIFLLVAGCFTPICLLALPPEIGPKLLSIVGIAVFLGVVKSMFWTQAPKWVSCLLYGCTIFLFIPYMQELKAGLGPLSMGFIWIGCAFYSVGAVFYAFKKPNFFPEIFGHHELFHIFTVIGAIFHFMVMYKLIQ